MKTSIIHWMDRQKLNATIKEKIRPAAVVLDIGCGIRPQKFNKPMIHICAEPFGQYIERLQYVVKRKGDADRHVIIQADWAKTVEIFPPHSVDTIYLIDVIEHLPKKTAQKLIKKTVAIARKQIIIFTPLGYLEQKHINGKDAWGMDGGKMQEHRSGWEPEDFDRSWDIYATEKFHTVDNLGHFYKKSHGAFYAVKNINLPKERIKSWRKNWTYLMGDLNLKISRKIKRYLSK